MILINLLPHREAARKRRRENFYAALGASALVGGLIAGGVYLWYAAQISDQQNRNVVLSNEIKRLDSQIKDIATLQQEIAGLRARQQAVEDLQADRNMPVHLLNELVGQLPDGVYIDNVKQDNQTVTIKGFAQSNERIAELLRNLNTNSLWLNRPDLVQITAETLSISPREQRRVAKFDIRFKVLRASEAQKAAAAGASGPQAPASAAAATAAATATASGAAKPAATPAKT